MKVAVVTDYFPTSSSPWDGHSAYQTLRPLAGMCDLHVFCPVATYPSLLRPKTAKQVDRAWRPAHVPVTYIPYTALPVISRPFNGLVMWARLLPQVRAFAPDILLNYVVYPAGFAAVHIGKSLHKPVVLTAIGSDLNRIPRMVGDLVRQTLRKADVVTTVSHDLAQTAVKLGAHPERTQAILNGCDTTVFHPQDRAAAREELKLDPNAEIVLYVGRLDVRKGLIELIAAVAALRATRPTLRCYLVGDGSDRSQLMQAIAHHKAEDIVTLIPPCPTAQVAQWMAAADLVTLPSYKEGCPNVVIEALAAGRPMVATNVGGIPELMDESCGRLIPPMDVPALTQAFDEVLSQQWNAEAIAAQHNRSWADVATDLFAVLEQTL